MSTAMCVEFITENAEPNRKYKCRLNVALEFTKSSAIVTGPDHENACAVNKEARLLKSRAAGATPAYAWLLEAGGKLKHDASKVKNVNPEYPDSRRIEDTSG